MSGETEKEVSGWTVDTLREHMERMVIDLSGKLDERYATQTKAVDAAFLAQQTAMQTALTAAERAVQTALLAAEKANTKAENAADKRFEAGNEFRGQLADQATHFIPRSEAEAAIGRNTERIQELALQAQGLVTRLELEVYRKASGDRFAELTKWVEQDKGHNVGLQAGWLFLVGAVSVITTIITLVWTLSH